MVYRLHWSVTEVKIAKILPHVLDFLVIVIVKNFTSLAVELMVSHAKYGSDSSYLLSSKIASPNRLHLNGHSDFLHAQIIHPYNFSNLWFVHSTKLLFF